MAAPVIYHGASNGNGPWPSSAAVGPSVLERSIWLGAEVFAANSSINQDNPPRFLWRNFGAGASEWFLRCISFPLAATGGAWAQAEFYLPSNLDTAPGTLTCTLCWSPGGVASANVVNWHMNFGADLPGRAIAGSGPGVQVNQIPVANEYMYAGPFVIAPTRAGAPEALVADRCYHLNVYRGDSNSVYQAYFFGVIIRYTILP